MTPPSTERPQRDAEASAVEFSVVSEVSAFPVVIPIAA
jgi:hypothetical protein